MANNGNGIIINIGFDSTSELNNYIKRIETQLNAIDWEKTIGLSDSFNKQYEKITKALQALKIEVANLDVMDVATLTKNLNSVTQTTNRLQKQFSALVDSLPIDMQARMNKSLGGVTTTLEAIGEVSNAASQSIVRLNDSINEVKPDTKSYDAFIKRLSEINKLLNDTATKGKINDGKLIKSEDFKDIDEAKKALYELYKRYNELVQNFKDHKIDFSSGKELQETFYKLKVMLTEVMQEFNIDDKERFTEKLIQIDDGKVEHEFIEVAKIIDNQYRNLIAAAKRRKEQFEKEAADLGYDVTNIAKSGEKDVRKELKDAEVIRLPIVIDEKSEEIFQTSLESAINKMQKVADQHPIHIIVDLASQYRTRLNDKTLEKIKGLSEDLNERLDKAIAKGTNKNEIQHLTVAAQDLEDLTTKLYSDINKAYEFDVKINTDWAAKQVKWFVEHTKEQLDTLKQDNIILGSQVEVDEGFKARIEKATEDIINDLEKKSEKIESALNRIAEFFSTDLGTDKDNAFQTERAALQKLSDSLNTVKKEVNGLGNEFLRFAESEGVAAYVEAVKAIEGAMEAANKVIGGASKITIEMDEGVSEGVSKLQTQINNLYNTEGITEWEDAYIESIQRISNAFKELLGASNKHVAYHYGNLGGGSPSHPLGDEIKAWFEGKRNGDRGWSDGTGTYISSNPNEYLDGDFSDELKKFYALDISQLKLLEKHVEEDAEAYYNFAHHLEQYCYKMGSSFTGFDENLQDVDPNSLYNNLQKVFGKSAITFEAFQSFLDEMIELIKGLDVKEDGAINASNLFKTKQKYGIDDIKTRFLKRLGYQGIDFSGTSFDTLKTGSVLFDTVDLKSIIIETGKTISDVIQKNNDTQSPETDNIKSLAVMSEKIVTAVERLSEIYLGQEPSTTRAQINIDPSTLTQSIIEALSSVVVNINTDSLESVINNAISTATINVAAIERKEETAHINFDVTQLETVINSALDKHSIKIDETILRDAINTALEQHVAKIDEASITEAVRAAIDLSTILSSLQEIKILLAPGNNADKIALYDKMLADYDERIAILKTTMGLKPLGRLSIDDELSDNTKEALSDKGVVEGLISLQTEAEKLSSVEGELSQELLNIVNQIKFAFKDLLDVKNPASLVAYFAKDIALSDKAAITYGRTISNADIKKILGTLGFYGRGKKSDDEVDAILADYQDKYKTDSVNIYKSAEHGGVLTKDGRIIGLTSSDGDISTKFADPAVWESMGVKMGEGVLSILHSHAGSDIWAPSIPDLKNAIKSDVAPFFTTMARQEISVIDTAKLRDVFGNYTEEQWTKFYNEWSHIANRVQAKQYADVGLSQEEIAQHEHLLSLNSYNKKISPAAYNHNVRDMAMRVALDHLLKEMGVGTDWYKSYKPDEFEYKNPFGLDQNTNVDLGSLVSILNKIVESVDRLNGTLSSNKINITSESDSKPVGGKFTLMRNSYDDTEIISFADKVHKSTNDIGKSLNTQEDQFQHLGVAAIRVLNEIGLSYDEYVNKVNSQKRGLDWGERLATISQGKIIDSIKGTMLWTGWDDSVKLNETIDKILHLHPYGKGMAEVFSPEDFLEYYKQVVDKRHLRPRPDFELIQNGQKTRLDFNGVSGADIGYVTTALMQIEDIVNRNLKQNGGTISSLYSDEYQQLYNSLIKSVMEKYGGYFSSEKDYSSKISKQFVANNFSILDQYTHYLRGDIDGQYHEMEDASSFIYLKQLFNQISQTKLTLDEFKQAYEQYVNAIVSQDQRLTDVNHETWEDWQHEINALKEKFPILEEVNKMLEHSTTFSTSLDMAKEKTFNDILDEYIKDYGLVRTKIGTIIKSSNNTKEALQGAFPDKQFISEESLSIQSLYNEIKKLLELISEDETTLNRRKNITSYFAGMFPNVDNYKLQDFYEIINAHLFDPDNFTIDKATTAISKTFLSQFYNSWEEVSKKFDELNIDYKVEEVQKNIQKLQRNFYRGFISEDTYDEEIQKLEKELQSLQALKDQTVATKDESIKDTSNINTNGLKWSDYQIDDIIEWRRNVQEFDKALDDLAHVSIDVLINQLDLVDKQFQKLYKTYQDFKNSDIFLDNLKELTPLSDADSKRHTIFERHQSSSFTLGRNSIDDAESLLHELEEEREKIVQARDELIKAEETKEEAKPKKRRGRKKKSETQQAEQTATEQTAESVKEETAQLNELDATAEKASKSKKKVTKANQELKESADTSASAIKDESDALNALNEFNSLADSLRGLFKKSFAGDENATVKVEATLERIIALYNELAKKPELLGDDSLEQRMTYLSSTIETIITDINNINVKNQGPEVKQQLTGIVDGLQSIQQLLASGDISGARSLFVQLADEMRNVGKVAKRDTVTALGQVDKLLDKINQELYRNPSMAKQYKDAYKSLFQEISQIQQQYGGQIPQQLAREFNARFFEIKKNADGTLRSVGAYLKRSAIQLAHMYLSWYRLISYIRQGVQEVINLDTALTKMSYTMEVTDSQLADMSKQMVSMAKDLSSSVENISQIYQIYANLQTTQEELEKTAKPTAILANLSGVDAATAADQLQGVLNQFQLTADDATHIVDVYDKISASIKVDYSKGIAGMADAVKNVGNYANEAGLSFEQLSAIVGRVMQQTRQEGGQIGVALKTIMTRVSKATKLAEDGEVDNKTLSQASAALKRFANIDVYTPSGEFREFDVIMTELAAKWDQLSDAEQKNISFAIAATRQTATLSAVLSNWNDAMNLATDAVNANGNALANQEKYEKSLAGHIQSLKTEFSALWIELLNSESLKDLIDSVKEMIVSLEDSATGLKPVIDILANILKLLTKIVTVIPAGGLVASILGLKYGKGLQQVLSTQLFTNLANSINLSAFAMGNFSTATLTAATSGNILSGIVAGMGTLLKANPLGVIISVASIGISLFNKFHKSAEEVHEELVKTYEDAEQKVLKTENDISSLNQQLEDQQRIIDDLSGKTLNYIEKQQLDDAKEMTKQLQLQLEAAKERKMIELGDQADADVALLKNSHYFMGPDEWNTEYANLKSKHTWNDEAGRFADETPWIVKAYMGIANWNLIDDYEEVREQAVEELNNNQEFLDKYKEYYDYLLKNNPNDFFLYYYDSIQQLADQTYMHLYPQDWDEMQFSNIFDTIDLKQFKKDFEKEYYSEYWDSDKPKTLGNIVNKLLNSGEYDDLAQSVSDAIFTKSDFRHSNNADIFGRQIWGEIKDGIEDAAESDPPKLDLATWFTDKSSIDSDKTWSDITDNLESGISSLGAVLEKHRNANEKIDPLEIFKITDTKDSIFQQLGFDKFEDYLNEYREEIYKSYSIEDAHELFANGKDIEYALRDYLKDVFQKVFEATGDISDIEGSDLFVKQIKEWINAAEGGSNQIDQLVGSYEELMGIYNQIQNGETLDIATMTDLIDRYDALGDAVEVVGDEYSIESDALVTLINQYIDYSNTAISSQYASTKSSLDGTKTRLEGMGYEMEGLKSLVRQYNYLWAAVDSSGTRTEGLVKAARMYRDEVLKRTGQDIGMQGAMNYVSSLPFDLFDDVNKYISDEDLLAKLKQQLDDLYQSKKDLSNDSGNEIDWIANSLENITRAAERAKEAYDNLFTTSGSEKGLKKANELLGELNDRLHDQELGAQKAADSYQKEIDKLGLSQDQIKKIENVALGREDAWTIQTFKGNSKLYDQMNKGLDLTKKRLEAEQQITNLQHQQTENSIQMRQNYSDYYGNLIAKYEAKIDPETSVKKQQKYVTKLIDLYQKQYAEEKAIAELKGDEIALAKLQAEEEQKVNELIVQRRQISIDDITTRYDRIISEFENRKSILEHGITMTEAKGSLVSTKYYEALIDNERDSADKLLAERKRLINELEKINTNSKEGLNQWWETKDAIDSVTAALYQSEEAMREYANAMRQVGWDLFDRITDTISGVSSEAEYLMNLLSHSDMFKYTKEIWSNDGSQTKVYYGGWSKEGLATLGLYELQMKTNRELANDYAEEIAKLNKEIKKHPTDLTLLDRRNELIEREREAIQAIEEEKQAILDLVKDGYDKQLESLSELSSKYMEALNAEKDLYDYQKSMAKKTKDLIKLRKQLAAYANDTSEEARGRIQRLTVELQEAEEDIQDTQYSHYLDDQQKLLDRMYNEYETFLNNKLDEREKLLEEMASKVDTNQKAINKTLREKTSELGTTLSQTMKNIWREPLNNNKTIEQVISAKDTDIKAIANSTKNTDTLLQQYINNYNKEGGLRTTINGISEKIDSLNTNLIEIAKKLGVDVTQMPTNKTNSSTGQAYQGLLSSSDFVKKKGKYQYVGNLSKNSLRDAYNEMDVKEGTGVKLKDDPRYGQFNIDDPEKYYKYMYQWLKRNGYASGVRRIPKSQLAWTQEKGLEAIIRPSDGAILTPLAKNDSVLNAGATQNIWDMANNPMQFIKDNLSFPINLPSNLSGGNYDIQQNMSITLPNVMNYNEFVTALQHDKQFERMMQDVTINQLTKPNALSKFKYKF